LTPEVEQNVYHVVGHTERSNTMKSTKAMEAAGLAISLATSLISGTGAVAAEQGAVEDRLVEISQRYTEVGQVLSDDDAAFVKEHASLAGPEQRGSASRSFSRAGSGAGGSGNLTGYMKTTNGPGLSNSYNFSANAAGSSRVNKTTVCGAVRGYGLVGSGGVGLVFSETPCATAGGHGQQISRGRPYSGLVAYSTLVVYGDFYTGSGSFRISS